VGKILIYVVYGRKAFPRKAPKRKHPLYLFLSSTFPSLQTNKGKETRIEATEQCYISQKTFMCYLSSLFNLHPSPSLSKGKDQGSIKTGKGL